MIHTQHELPPMSDERNKMVFSGYMPTARQYGILDNVDIFGAISESSK